MRHESIARVIADHGIGAGLAGANQPLLRRLQKLEPAAIASGARRRDGVPAEISGLAEVRV